MKINSVLKKIIVLTLIGTTAMSFAPKKSHALVGVVTGFVPLMIVGGGMVVSGAILTESLLNNGNPAGLLTFLGGLVGLVALDDHHQVTPHFTALSTQAAANLNIASDEMNAFNNELSSINVISQSIASETMTFNQPNTSADALNSFVGQKWADYSPMLSPAAQSALKKVQTNLSATINQAARAN